MDFKSIAIFLKIVSWEKAKQFMIVSGGAVILHRRQPIIFIYLGVLVSLL